MSPTARSPLDAGPSNAPFARPGRARDRPGSRPLPFEYLRPAGSGRMWSNMSGANG